MGPSSGRCGPSGRVDGLEALAQKLSSGIDVCVIIEGSDHLRQAEFRDRAHVYKAGEPAYL